jgi:ESS family glutamate:Na+ symporter
MRTIPPAILIGVIVNLALSVLGIEPSLLPNELSVLRDTLLVVFFICVGLSLSCGEIKSVLPPVLWVVAATLVLIVGQNLGGVFIASLFGEQLHTGVLLGSVSFVGGLGSAVAWGAVLEDWGVRQATPIGVAGAMLGMVLGAIIAGPFGEMLAGGRRQESATNQVSTSIERSGSEIKPSIASSARVWPRDPSTWVFGLTAIGVAFVLGHFFQVLLRPLRVMLPQFLTAMLASVVLIIIAPERVKAKFRPFVLALESRVLNLFLVLTFATLDYRALAGMGPQVLATATFQVVLTVSVAWLVVFIPISRLCNYGGSVSQQRAEAAATAAAVVGFGLSSLSVAMAVLAKMGDRSHPLPRARQTIAVTGAGVVDLLNALGIGISLWFLS